MEVGPSSRTTKKGHLPWFDFMVHGVSWPPQNMVVKIKILSYIWLKITFKLEGDSLSVQNLDERKYVIASSQYSMKDRTP